MSLMMFFFFKQKTAYEMRISDWSSDVCSSDLRSLSVPGMSCSMNSTTVTSLPSARYTVHFQADDAAADHEQLLRHVGQLERVGGVHHPQIGRASCRERVCQYV